MPLFQSYKNIFCFFRCRGTTKWVHQACIQRWVDEKQKGNTNVNVECPQCGTAYVIRFPRPTFIVSILDSGDMLIQRMCPIITGKFSCSQIVLEIVLKLSPKLSLRMSSKSSLNLSPKVPEPLFILDSGDMLIQRMCPIITGELSLKMYLKLSTNCA